MRNRWQRLIEPLKEQLRLLLTINPSDRRWQMPFAAALATGLPLFVGAWFDRLDYGLVSSLGGLVFLNLPATPLSHRMVTLMACAFGMIACYTLGLMSHFFPWTMVPVLVFISVLVTMVCRFYRIGMPSSLFIIMAAAIGMYTPLEVLQVPLMVGLISMGTLLAALIAFFYSLYVLRLQAPKPVEPLPPASFDYVVFDSVLIGVFVGISLALAQALQLEKAYWVPVSCLAVIQGVSLRAVWNKQLQRILGTGIGLLVAWGMLLLPLDKWTIPLMMMVLCFVVETAVVRHYAFAAIFITPMTILLAEAATLGHGSASTLIEARFYDTVLGCLVGLVGAVCLHSPRFRQMFGDPMRRLIPARLERRSNATSEE
ncbi:FUSC family protein [Pseudomonas sp. IC_126]|uniref:FUSC family protein n=1 Tax=Pseudomonas sp. IC_126 TaxID=2547400 RepID=UPI00103E2029|nr:FUSC family protein [Pseudomonas sp. IC_126]TCD22124.1 FUSC family protein [Pseudomonas sp. IC_126]